ncbi:hypothetical protein WG66_003059 [Moniliophthora roreri]|nr:hypothetical protein WG66_003059 [Moniliophthora roreri]
MTNYSVDNGTRYTGAPLQRLDRILTTISLNEEPDSSHVLRMCPAVPLDLPVLTFAVSVI